MNILIPNIGRRGYLVKYIKETKNFDGKVYVSDCVNTASGLYGRNDGAFILPKPVDNEEKYVSDLLNLCNDKDIKIIIPIIDPEIYILSKFREKFLKKNIMLMVSSEQVLNICYNKLEMNEFLKKNKFLFPKTYNEINRFQNAISNREIDFPVIIKPIYGSGSEDTYIVNSMEEVNAHFKEGSLIQQFIEGQEYGVDVFNDKDNKPIRCVVKKKLAMRSGETDKAISVKDSNIQSKVIDLAKHLKHFGNMDCDVIVNNDNVYFIDLNPRFGGGYPTTHEANVNLLELIIQLAQGKEIKADFDNYKENVLVMKEVAIVSTEVKIDE